MSKKSSNKKNKPEASSSTSSELEAGKNKERKPIGTVAERLYTKAETAHKFAADALKLAKARRVPQETIAVMETFMVDIGGWRDKVKMLVDEGWEPAEAATMQDLVVGEAIAIDPEHVEQYAYIPGVREGSIRLVAGEIRPAGRTKNVLLKVLATGEQSEQIHGWAPLSHLIRQ